MRPMPALRGACVNWPAGWLPMTALHVLLTCPDPLPPIDGVLAQSPPPDTPTERGRFWTIGGPIIGIFAEGELRPALIEEAARRKLPLTLVDDARAPACRVSARAGFPD